MSSDPEDDRARIENYKWWQWALSLLFLPVLILMIIGVSSRRLRPKLTAARIWAFSVLGALVFFACVGIIGTLVEPETPSAGPPPAQKQREIAATRSPTSTPIPIYTSTPKPTATPWTWPTAIPQSSPGARGLGVSRSSIQSVYEQRALGFVFESSPLRDGTPRSLGSDSEGTIIELIGPDRDITKAYMSSIVVGDRTLNGLVLLGTFMESVIPAWEEGILWPGEYAEAAIMEGVQQTRYGDIQVKLEWYDFSGSLGLSISKEN